MTGLILAIEDKSLPTSLKSTGFHLLDPEQIFTMFTHAGVWLGPRGTLEERESFRQIIPYIVVASGDRVVHYKRADSGSENRLHGRVSIGLGGHVDLSDLIVSGNIIDLKRTLLAAANRELREELGIAQPLTLRWIGLLVDNDSPVGRVHIGVVGILGIEEGPVESAEESVTEASLLTLDDVMDRRDTLERWSDLLVPHLRGKLG